MDVARAVGGVGRDLVALRIVDTLAGVLNVEDLVPQRPEAEQIHE